MKMTSTFSPRKGSRAAVPIQIPDNMSDEQLSSALEWLRGYAGETPDSRANAILEQASRRLLSPRRDMPIVRYFRKDYEPGMGEFCAYVEAADYAQLRRKLDAK